MSRDELKQKATELGLEFKGNISNDALETLIEEAEFAVKGDTFESPKETSKALVESGKSKTDMRQEALLMKRCVITPLAETMRDLPSELYSVGSPKLGFIKKVVRFGVETLEPMVILNYLKEKKTLIQVKSVVNGKQIVTKRMSSAFSIEFLPDLTEVELEGLKK